MSTPAEARTINITSIEAKKSSKGKPFWKVATEDGEYMQIWKPDIYDRVKDGGAHTVMVEANTSGDKTFYNIVGIGAEEFSGNFLDDMSTPPPPSPIKRGTDVIREKQQAAASISATQLQTARAFALQAAASLVAADKANQKDLLVLAGKLSDYIMNGRDEHKSSTNNDGLDPDNFLDEG